MLKNFGGRKVRGRNDQSPWSTDPRPQNIDQTPVCTVETPQKREPRSNRRLDCTVEQPCDLRRGFHHDSDSDERLSKLWPPEFEPLDEETMRDIASEPYKPLLPWQTRMICLHPAPAFEDELVCDMIPVDFILGDGVGAPSLRQIVQYVALSYSWGYPAFTCSIKCNDRRFPITQHLATALRHIRKRSTFLREGEHSVMHLWVDAFCINQYDLEEKARQVENMFVIYQKASKVMAWLGPNPSAFSQLIAAGSMAAQKSENVFSGFEKSGTDPESGNKDENLSSQAIGLRHRWCQKHVSELKTCFAGVFSKSAWFNRTWVRQEVYAAREVCLRSGAWEKDIEYFSKAVRRLEQELFYIDPQNRREREPSNLDFPVGYLCWNSLADSRKALHQYHRRDGRDYLAVMVEGSRFAAADDRDRVYGVVGMLEGSKLSTSLGRHVPDLFPVDYSLSFPNVCYNFIRHVIHRTDSHNILCVFSAAGQRLPNPLEASWALDFQHDCNRLIFPGLKVMSRRSVRQGYSNLLKN